MTSIKKATEVGSACKTEMRVQCQLFCSVQQPETQCCVGRRDFQDVSLTDMAYYLLPNEHESMRRKARIC